MEYLSGAVPYELPGWRIASAATAISTVHALYKQGAEVICFGVGLAGPVRDLNAGAVVPFLEAIDAQLLSGGFPGNHGLSRQAVAGFDALAHISGTERRFTRGWANGSD